MAIRALLRRWPRLLGACIDAVADRQAAVEYNVCVAIERPALQRAINNASFFLLGVTALGTLLDSASNAINLVSPVVTWVGIGSIVVIWLGTHLALRFRAVTWRTPDNTSVHPVTIPVGAKWATAGVLCLLLLPRLAELRETPRSTASLMPPPRIVATERTTVFVFIPSDNDGSSARPRSVQRVPPVENLVPTDSRMPARPSVLRESDTTGATLLKRALPSGGFLNARFFARDVDGRIFNRQSFVGKVVVVNMTATWCQPCRVELPLLADFSYSHPDRVVVLAVAEGEDFIPVRRFADGMQLRLPLIPDRDGQFSKWFPGKGIVPRTYVVAADGQVIFEKIGLIDVTELEHAVFTALSIPAA